MLNFQQLKLSILKDKRYAFFAHILLSVQLTYDANNDAGIASTDGHQEITFFPRFLTLNQEDQITVILHEILHIAFMHRFRKGNREIKRWNLACDYSINNLLQSEYKRVFDTLGGCLNDLYLKHSPEEIYNLLPANTVLDYSYDINRDDLSDFSPLDDEILTKQKIMLKSAQISASLLKPEKQTHSLIQLECERLFELYKPAISWRKRLAHFLTNHFSSLKTKQTNLPHRRYLAHDFYLPSFKPETKIDLQIFVDISGSISEEILGQFISEVKSILKTLKPEKLIVYGFSDKLTQPYSLTSLSDFKVLLEGLKSGSSTYYAPIHEKLSKGLNLIFTDGFFFDDPRQFKIKPETKIIWVMEEMYIQEFKSTYGTKNDSFIPYTRPKASTD